MTPGLSAPQGPVDKVLVTDIQIADGSYLPRLMAIHHHLSTRLAPGREVVPMSSVPHFDKEGYDAGTYLQGCPPGQYAGCALVLGERTLADWVVGGVATPVPHPDQPGVMNLEVKITFVDVLQKVEVANFGVLFDGVNDELVADSVAKVFERVTGGAYDREDVRVREEELAAAALRERETREKNAAALTQMEGQLGQASVAEVTLNETKLTREDLAKYKGGQGTTPWEQNQMTENEYLRYMNSGDNLNEWRDSRKGRFGRLILRGAAGGGSGPYSQTYEGKLLRDGNNVNLVLHKMQVLQVVNAGASVVEGEVGLGILPFVDVGFHAGWRPGKVASVIDEDVQGQVALPGQETRFSLNGLEWGPRVTVVPFPRSVIRPSLAAGVNIWSGAVVQSSDAYTVAPRPTMMLLQILPGAEFAASDHVHLFGRASVELPLSGGQPFVENEGEGLPVLPVVGDGPKMGWGVHAGVAFLSPRLFGGRANKGRVAPVFDDDGL